jgi:MFS transporter, FSR family, fosmidomycin resistance protein
MREGVDRRAMVALSGGHMATDFAGGALPALLPFFRDKFSLSYTLAAALVLGSTFASSIIQPLFGIWSDRRGAMWLLPAGAALAGIGIALAADAPSYGLVFGLVVVSGVGVAAFHPEGSKFASFVSGQKRASGMSYFNIGGNMGYALGPLVATALVLWLGLKGGLLLMIPGLAAAVVLLAQQAYLRGFIPERVEGSVAEGVDRPWAMANLLGVVAFRTTAWFGLLVFVPLWEVSLGHSKAAGGRLLALMLLSGGIGTLVLGPLADRYGRRLVLRASIAAMPPLILVFIAVGGVPGAIALALVGACTVGTFGVTIVLAQEYLPRQIGLASGLSVGFAIGLGGIAAVALGVIADSVSLQAALYVCALAPIPGIFLALLLPPGRAVGSSTTATGEATWQRA